MTDVLITECRQFVADHYHSLPGFSEPRHGHNWELEVTVRDDAFFRLNSVLDAWVSEINYSLLNEQNTLVGRNPTAEILAECIFNHLCACDLRPVQVRVREKSNFWATCMREPGEL
jgi:6-pyruvoyl-tetrahydropterin synthase